MSRLNKSALIAAVSLMGGGMLVATGGHGQPAPPAPRPERACFWAHDVNGFNAPDEKTVYIRVGVNAIYRLDLMYDCTGLTFRQDIGLERQPGRRFLHLQSHSGHRGLSGRRHPAALPSHRDPQADPRRSHSPAEEIPTVNIQASRFLNRSLARGAPA